MEYWNADVEKEVLALEIPLLQCEKGPKQAIMLLPRSPIIPPFQYSNIPILSEAK
jgi:hypothetical protein